VIVLLGLPGDTEDMPLENDWDAFSSLSVDF
jgi:hypothetical protein